MIRIGVFICHCGTNIAGFVDAPAIAEYARSLPHVAFVKENQYSCSESGASEIKSAIREHHLDRVVVAACTPRTHEPVFRKACQEAGLNPFFFEFVNIREHCSWIHMKEREEGTRKAQDLIRMGVARAALLEPQEEIVAPVLPVALVIGGGLAGMTSAAALARRGFQVILVEKERELGGLLRGLHLLYPSSRPAREVLTEQIQELRSYPHLEIYTSCRVARVSGYIGNYQVTLTRGEGAPEEGQTTIASPDPVAAAANEDKSFEAPDLLAERGEVELKVGIIVLATGAEVHRPAVGTYGYDGQRIITQWELEGRLRENRAGDVRNVVMIQCVGAMSEERVYCSKICCMTAIKNALILKERCPEARIHILYRDIQSYGTTYEATLRQAKEAGIRFVCYDPASPPKVDAEAGTVRVYHQLLGRELTLPFDLVVLATPLVARPEAEEMSRLLKVPLDADRFFLEAHVKLSPLDFATDGIYICGCAHWPADSAEVAAQALGTAGRSSVHLARESVTVEPIVSSVSYEDLCRGCGLCVALCPYGAIELVETAQGVKAHTISVACKGCGVCGAACYVKAIKMNHYSDEQIEAQIEAFGE